MVDLPLVLTVSRFIAPSLLLQLCRKPDRCHNLSLMASGWCLVVFPFSHTQPAKKKVRSRDSPVLFQSCSKRKGAVWTTPKWEARCMGKRGESEKCLSLFISLTRKYDKNRSAKLEESWWHCYARKVCLAFTWGVRALEVVISFLPKRF